MFFSRITDRQAFWALLTISVLIKLGVALAVPMTGDEAYFVVWGKALDYGYYDHPPMVGWWLAGLLQVSDAVWWLRLPTIITTTIIGVAIYYYARGRGAMPTQLRVRTTRMRPGHLRKNGVPYSENATLEEYYDRFTEPTLTLKKSSSSRN